MEKDLSKELNFNVEIIFKNLITQILIQVGEIHTKTKEFEKSSSENSSIENERKLGPFDIIKSESKLRSKRQNINKYKARLVAKEYS